MTITTFSSAWDRSRAIDGWLTASQARLLFETAQTVRAGRAIIEIGSHHGRSTVLLASAKASGVNLVAVDPYADERWGGGEEAIDVFRSNLQAAGLADEVALERVPGSEAGEDWRGPEVGMLYVDGAHDYHTVLADLRAWLPHLAPEAFLLLHDSYSSIGVTGALFRLLFAHPGFVYQGAAGSLIRFRRSGEHDGASRLRGRVRMLLRLRWFARNVVIKVAMRRGWTRVPVWLGHDQDGYPY